MNSLNDGNDWGFSWNEMWEINIDDKIKIETHISFDINTEWQHFSIYSSLFRNSHDSITHRLWLISSFRQQKLYTET